MIAVVALSAAVPRAALAAGPEQGTIVTVELELQANHGLQARLDTDEDQMVTLALSRRGRLVSYEVKGEVTETGLTVHFGRLGKIDVAFTPSKTLSSTEPPAGCEGQPRTLREGVFAGTIDFAGEREYVRIEGSQTEGSMSVISQWRCPEAPPLFPEGSGPPASSSRQGSKPVYLVAQSRRRASSFYAKVYRSHGRGRSVFYGVKGERREGMRIFRETIARGGAGAFVFDRAAGIATIRPPRPFSGHATFKRRHHRRDLWRSTIRIPLLGAAPLRPSGGDFRVFLSR